MGNTIQPTPNELLRDLLYRFATMTDCLAAQNLLLYELIRLAPTDTIRQLHDTLLSTDSKFPREKAVKEIAAELVSAALNGVQPKNMRDILKIIPGGKSDS